MNGSYSDKVSVPKVFGIFSLLSAVHWNLRAVFHDYVRNGSSFTLNCVREIFHVPAVVNYHFSFVRWFFPALLNSLHHELIRSFRQFDPIKFFPSVKAQSQF